MFTTWSEIKFLATKALVQSHHLITNKYQKPVNPFSNVSFYKTLISSLSFHLSLSLSLSLSNAFSLPKHSSIFCAVVTTSCPSQVLHQKINRQNKQREGCLEWPNRLRLLSRMAVLVVVSSVTSKKSPNVYKSCPK